MNVRLVQRAVFHHGGEVLAVAAGRSANGDLLLASGGSDGVVQLWDPFSDQPLGEGLLGHGGVVQAVAFGAFADGRAVLASGSTDGTVRLWDASTGEPVSDRPLFGHNDNWVSAVDLGFDRRTGQLLLASADEGFDEPGRLVVWDVVTGEPILVEDRSSGGIGAVAFHQLADGSLVLAVGGEDGNLGLWDPRKGQVWSALFEYLAGGAWRELSAARGAISGALDRELGEALSGEVFDGVGYWGDTPRHRCLDAMRGELDAGSYSANRG